MLSKNLWLLIRIQTNILILLCTVYIASPLFVIALMSGLLGHILVITSYIRQNNLDMLVHGKKRYLWPRTSFFLLLFGLCLLGIDVHIIKNNYVALFYAQFLAVSVAALIVKALEHKQRLRILESPRLEDTQPDDIFVPSYASLPFVIPWVCFPVEVVFVISIGLYLSNYS